MNKTIMRYASYGIIFGLCFPLGALLLERFVLGHALSIAELHQRNKLLYMINTAPLFLGIFAAIGGYFRGKADQLILDLTKQSEERSKALKESDKMKEQLSLIMKDINDIAPYLQDNVHKLDHSLINIMERLDRTTLLAVNSIENISLTLSGLAENTSGSSQQLDHSLSSLHTYETKLSHYQTRISSIEDKIDGSDQRLTSLLEKSKRILNVMTLLQDIATNTQLIAFNTSIEAAKLQGEGNSFMVIANEINKLSSASSKAVSEIAPLLKDINKDIQCTRDDFKDTNKELLEGARIIADFGPFIDDLSNDILTLQKSISTTSDVLVKQSVDINEISSQTKDFSTLRDDVEIEIKESKEPMENSIQIIEEIISKLS